MAYDCEMSKKGRSNWRCYWYIYIVCLVVWTASAIALAAQGKIESFRADQEILRTKRVVVTPHQHQKRKQLDPVEASRCFLAKLLTDDVLHGGTERQDIWKDAFLDGVPMVASETMALLLHNIRPPLVRLAPCEKDLTLDPLPSSMKRIFIASNQHQSQDILPNFIRQVLTLILENPQITFFISIYESGSVDKTPYLLLLFSRVLKEIDVEHMIEYNGSLQRKKDQERIEFLAEVRNAALQPLIDHSKKGVFYDRVIFINDVFFCKEDMHRLLLHDGDINCGMDFTHRPPWQKPAKFDPNQLEAIKRQYYKERIKDDEDARKAAETPAALHPWDHKTGTEPYKYVATNPDTWLKFYDIWVSHDAAGRHFVNNVPFVRNNSYEHERLKQGLPFPGECCWNGVAILNPEPFTKHNLVFRAAAEDECPTSECILLCHDFQRLGYSKVIIDPSIRTSYEYVDARLLHLVGVHAQPKVSWKTVREASPMKDIRIKPGDLVDCCPLHPGKELVDFGECRSNYSIWNVTSALERLNLKEEAVASIPAISNN